MKGLEIRINKGVLFACEKVDIGEEMAEVKVEVSVDLAANGELDVGGFEM